MLSGSARKESQRVCCVLFCLFKKKNDETESLCGACKVWEKKMMRERERFGYFFGELVFMYALVKMKMLKNKNKKRPNCLYYFCPLLAYYFGH
jgi:hypothetical protein